MDKAIVERISKNIFWVAMGFALTINFLIPKILTHSRQIEAATVVGECERQHDECKFLAVKKG